MKNGNYRNPVVIGRFWEKDKNGRYLGYLDFGTLGRLRVRLMHNNRKVNADDNDFILLADPEDTPFGMLGDLRNAGRKLEDKIDQALWEGNEEEETAHAIDSEPVLTASLEAAPKEPEKKGAGET